MRRTGRGGLLDVLLRRLGTWSRYLLAWQSVGKGRGSGNHTVTFVSESEYSMTSLSKSAIVKEMPPVWELQNAQSKKLNRKVEGLTQKIQGTTVWRFPNKISYQRAALVPGTTAAGSSSWNCGEVRAQIIVNSNRTIAWGLGGQRMSGVTIPWACTSAVRT